VDAVLLARDDAATHYEYARPFLKTGKHIFIDKPLAIKISEANKILNAQQFDNQVFSCSSLRYAKELMLTKEDEEKIGTIKLVEGSVMKKWETYGIHILEPLVSQLPQRGKLKNVQSQYTGEIRQVMVQWENISGYFKTTGNTPAPLEIKFFGDKGNITKTFADSFNAFKNSLEVFIDVIHHPAKNIAREETLELVTILEKGLV
jgi:predicted dehydrogenase